MISQKYNLIIDLNALIYRYSFGLKGQINEENIDIGGINGIFNLLLSLTKQFDFCNIFVCVDHAESTFKKKQLFSLYKAGRPPMPNFIFMQLKILLKFFNEIGLHIYQQSYYEGDDIIFTLAKKLSDNKESILILTTDKDLLQIMELDNVLILLLNSKKRLFTTKFEIWDFLGIFPCQIPDFLALSGDASDNIPGMPKIGKKTAIKLLKQFNNVINLLQNLNQIENLRIRQSIEKNKDLLLTFLTLTTLKFSDEIKLKKLNFKLWMKNKKNLEYKFKTWNLDANKTLIFNHIINNLQ